MNVNKKYVVLKKEYCTLDSNTGMWSFKLPDDFTQSRYDRKRITVLNFMYYATWVPRTGGNMIQIDFTELHSPTLCDGNYNQDYYIATLCYTYNTYHKIFPIKTQSQYLEFYFRDGNGALIESFWYQTDINEVNYSFAEKFNIDLELIY